MGPFKKFGEISVRKIAMPIATGMAKRSEREVVTKVPKMFVKAPKFSFTGSQWVDVRNLITPNRWIAREDSRISTYKIPAIRKMTVKEAMPVTKENKRSAVSFFAVLAGMCALQSIWRETNRLRELFRLEKPTGQTHGPA